jgi:hypothetical protein
MRLSRWCIGAALFCVFDLCGAVQGFAQSNTGLHVTVLRSSTSAVRTYAPIDHRTGAPPTLPSNLVVPPDYREVVEAMLLKSPTFRRQCQRIADTPRMVVAMTFDARQKHPELLAITRLLRTDAGFLRAMVEIKEPVRRTELIAHELEHVIEHLDGIDLATKADQPSSGVRRVVVEGRRPIFETSRAIEVGLKVAREIRDTP